MIKVTVRKADGTSSVSILQPTQILMMDRDGREERDRKGANTVVTMLDGRKMWVQETTEEIAQKMGL